MEKIVQMLKNKIIKFKVSKKYILGKNNNNLIPCVGTFLIDRSGKMSIALSFKKN